MGPILLICNFEKIDLTRSPYSLQVLLNSLMFGIFVCQTYSINRRTGRPTAFEDGKLKRNTKSLYVGRGFNG